MSPGTEFIRILELEVLEREGVFYIWHLVTLPLYPFMVVYLHG